MGVFLLVGNIRGRNKMTIW